MVAALRQEEPNDVGKVVIELVIGLPDNFPGRNLLQGGITMASCEDYRINQATDGNGKTYCGKECNGGPYNRFCQYQEPQQDGLVRCGK